MQVFGSEPAAKTVVGEIANAARCVGDFGDLLVAVPRVGRGRVDAADMLNNSREITVRVFRVVLDFAVGIRTRNGG